MIKKIMTLTPVVQNVHKEDFFAHRRADIRMYNHVITYVEDYFVRCPPYLTYNFYIITSKLTVFVKI
jgi:hypothetical protein